MATGRRLKILRGYYISAHRTRMDFYSWKWRLFVILLAGLAILFINDYLQTKYVGTVAFEAKADGSLEAASYTVGDKLFNWFMTGMLFGIVALAILYEGEFILGLRKMVVRFEKQAGRGVERTLRGEGNSHPLLQGGQRRKNVKQRRK